MSKTVTRSVTETLVQVAKIEVVEGVPEMKEYPTQKFQGNLSLERATKRVNVGRKADERLTVIGVTPEITKYEMPLDVFMANAKIVEQE